MTEAFTKAKLKRFKLKRKPTRPKRKQIPDYREIHDGTTPAEKILEDIEHIQSQGAELDEIRLVVERYWESCEVRWEWLRPETEEEYQVRLEAYKKSLKKWKKWQSENEELIKAKIAFEKEEAEKEAVYLKKRAEKEKLARLKRLEKEISKLKETLK